MIGHSYLILSPSAPSEIADAAMMQRQSIPLAWAFASASAASQLHREGPTVYIATRVADAVTVLDRGIGGWSYNSYLSDTLAPIAVFRTWLANHAPDTWMYLNISELIELSPSPEEDIAELRRLPEKVKVAFEEIEDKNFTNFLQELRKLSYPLITVPVTGDRRVDMQILKYEIRDTSSVEDEMALQMIGVDRDKSTLRQAVQSIRLHKGQPPAEMERFVEEERELTLFATDPDRAYRLLVDELGMEVVRVGAGDRVELRYGETTVALLPVADTHRPPGQLPG